LSNLQIFEPLHIKILILIIASWVIIPAIGNQIQKKYSIFYISIIFAILALSQEIFMVLYRVNNGSFEITQHLPVHLCSFAVFCSSYALLTKNKIAFELSFYWGLTGTLQALFTPSPVKPFPHLEFIMFFFSHSLVVLIVIWMIFVIRMKIGKYSWIRAFIATNILAVIIGLLNLILDANYMFLCKKPPVNHVLLVGNEPFHIITFEIWAIIFFLSMYQIMKYYNRVSKSV